MIAHEALDLRQPLNSRPEISAGLRHAVVNGSLGIGNLGDETLLATLMDIERQRYGKWSVIGGAQRQAADGVQMLRSPLFAMGRVPWRGMLSQLRLRRTIEEFGATRQRDYVWVGGLFGCSRHILLRAREAQWCRSFCERIVCYFGDAEYGMDAVPAARQLAAQLNSGPSWVAVRSEDAAQRLSEAGYGGRIWLGLDIVLHTRVRRWGVPFSRRATAGEAIVINPVRHKMEYAPVWIGAATAAVQSGLPIHWVSFADPDDLEVCRILRSQIASEFPRHPQRVCSTREAESAVQRAALCVATRYHAAIFAFTSGVPVIAVPYSAKVSRLFKRFGLSRWLVDADTGAGGWLQRFRDLRTQSGWDPDWKRILADADSHDTALNSL
jgi:polysaccharide pyruvyl transferase WcaK-like protein